MQAAQAAGANVVLVHGAWCDGSVWCRVIPQLQAAGHRVVAVQLPLTTLADDIATTRRAIAKLASPTVLVGHAYGGMVISGAAAAAPGVTGLVYIAGYAGDVGECVGTINQRYPLSEGERQTHADADGYLTLHVDTFAEVFADDVDPAQARLLATVQKPTSMHCFTGALEAAAWHDLPAWYLIAGGDRMVPVAAQHWMAERMGATIQVVPSSHALHLAHPHDVVLAVAAAAKQAVPA